MYMRQPVCRAGGRSGGPAVGRAVGRPHRGPIPNWAPQGNRQGNIIAKQGPNQYPLVHKNSFLINKCVFSIFDI